MAIQGSKAGILTPALCRGARGLLNWTQAELAEKAQVSRSTIRDYEGGRHDLHRATALQLRAAFEAEGVRLQFLDEGVVGLLFSEGSATAAEG